MTIYDAIRGIKVLPTLRKEDFRFMASRIKKLEQLEIVMVWVVSDWSKSTDWRKTFCDFLNSQSQSLTEITFKLYGYDIVADWPEMLDYTKFLYEAINKFCPRVDMIFSEKSEFFTNNSLEKMKEYFPYPMIGPWKNIQLKSDF